MKWTNKNKSLSTIALVVGVVLLALSIFFRPFGISCLGAAFIFLALGIKFKKWESFGIVIFSTLLGISIMEFVIPLFPTNTPSRTHYIGSYITNYFISTDIGRQGNPGIHASKKLTTNSGELIYEAKYSIGGDGFRKTPNENLENQHRVNFFGCSFTFGEGINDDETLPYFVKQISSNLSVKNFGFHGYGVHQALAILQSDRDTSGQINFLLTAPWQAPRSACIPRYSAGSPSFRLNKNGTVERAGICTPKPESKLEKTLSQSELYKFAKDKISPLMDSQDEQIELYLALIKEMKKISSARGQKFIIGFIKASNDWFHGSYSNDKIYQRLLELDVEVIDLTLAESEEKIARQYYIHEQDKHPSAPANKERAQMLSKLITEALAQDK